jgi:hypothetical protein
VGDDDENCFLQSSRGPNDRKRAQTTPDASFVSSLRYKEGLGGQ